jgi:hypothetical protein
MPSSGVAGQRSEAMVLRLARRSREVVHDRGWAFIAADAGRAGPSALVAARRQTILGAWNRSGEG